MIFDFLKRGKTKKRSNSSSDFAPVISSTAFYNIFNGYLDPMRASTVYACVKVLGESIAMLPWEVFKYGSNKNADGTPSSYPPKYEQWDHPLNNCLLKKANPNLSAIAFRMFMMRSLVLTGDAYAYVVRDSRDRCVELWALDPRRVAVTLREDGTLRYDVSFLNGKYIPDCPRDQLFHVQINPGDEYGMHGVNPIALQRRLLNIDDNAIDSLVTQYNNGINTNLSISMPDGIFLEGDRFTRLQKQINESYAGVKNSGKPLLLEGGLKAQPLGISNKDSQFLELYQFTQEQICKIFRVPPHMIGDLTHATFSNIEHQSIEFLNYCLTPYIKAFEEAAYSDLLNESEKEKYTTSFDTTYFERGDRASRFASYNTGIQNGIYSANEVRAMEDMAPREGGDVYLTPLNMVPSGDDSNTDKEQKEAKEEDEKNGTK